jgi:hypothetical protein
MTRYIRAFVLVLLVILMNASFVAAASAQTGGNPSGGNPSGGNPSGGNPSGTTVSTGLTNPLNGVSTLDQFLTAILNGVIRLGTIVLIMMLVYVGFLFVVARGNAEKLQGAKSALLWTVIGGLVLLGATGIQAIITGTVNSIVN